MYNGRMSCPRIERARFNNKWRSSVGSSAADALYAAMFFAKMHVGTDARVEYKSDEQMLVATSTTRGFELKVPKNGYLVTVISGGKETRIQNALDVVALVPPVSPVRKG